MSWDFPCEEIYIIVSEILNGAQPEACIAVYIDCITVVVVGKVCRKEKVGMNIDN